MEHKLPLAPKFLTLGYVYLDMECGQRLTGSAVYDLRGFETGSTFRGDDIVCPYARVYAGVLAHRV